MVWLVLSDEQWSQMEPHCLGKPGDPGRNGMDNRMFMEAVLWKARTGSAWAETCRRFLGRVEHGYSSDLMIAAKGVFERLFQALSDDFDMEYA